MPYARLLFAIGFSLVASTALAAAPGDDVQQTFADIHIGDYDIQGIVLHVDAVRDPSNVVIGKHIYVTCGVLVSRPVTDRTMLAIHFNLVDPGGQYLDSVGATLDLVPGTNACGADNGHRIPANESVGSVRFQMEKTELRHFGPVSLTPRPH